MDCGFEDGKDFMGDGMGMKFWGCGGLVVWEKSTEMRWEREKFMGIEWIWGRQFI